LFSFSHLLAPIVFSTSFEILETISTFMVLNLLLLGPLSAQFTALLILIGFFYPRHALESINTILVHDFSPITSLVH